MFEKTLSVIYPGMVEHGGKMNVGTGSGVSNAVRYESFTVQRKHGAPPGYT